MSKKELCLKDTNLKAAYIAPHPPIIIPDIGRGEEKKIASTSKALKTISEEISQIEPEAIIIITPHSKMHRGAVTINTAKIIEGSMRQFGCPDLNLSANNNTDIVKNIIKKCKKTGFPYAAVDMSLDHGSFVPLYFIASELSNFSLVHINYGIMLSAMLEEFGSILSEVIEEKKCKSVFIASGDLSHRLLSTGPYGFAPEGPKFDKEFVRIIEKGCLSEFAEISPVLAERAGECGLNSFLVLSGLLSCYEYSQELLSYEGPFGVGYGVARFKVESIRQEEDDEESEEVFNGKKKFILPDSQTKDPYIKLARKSITYYLKYNKFLKCKNADGIQSGKAGVFVCLKKEGTLRGCIGTILPTKSSVSEETIKNAVSAALNDPRFPPVDLSEMNDIICSVDILSEPEEIKSVSDLDVKRFGVIVSSGSRTGLLLPNLEGIDSVGMQVAIALQKGGISPEEPYTMYRFEVIRHE
ncbi:AmmeMemoRadiSam system protein A [Treponema sp. OMZ 788]|uniref:AmmeMemoRadiSam system protein A n=1 Tax=Treponema sp. OMZ 788 TaxID=2563664 RepID=UPI0020A27013|nr:AmmeMemoRadiSam system protein A [Treponema sp. OMZ 788]UTC63999.1 AmmeMemoRadiSam system protein A [Treponema sp. OMZ 788]